MASSRYDENVPMDREPSLRDRVMQLEKALAVLQEGLAEANEMIRRLTREVGID